MRNYDNELIKSSKGRNTSQKTDWLGYTYVLICAVFLAYLIGHLVISL